MTWKIQNIGIKVNNLDNLCLAFVIFITIDCKNWSGLPADLSRNRWAEKFFCFVCLHYLSNWISCKQQSSNLKVIKVVTDIRKKNFAIGIGYQEPYNASMCKYKAYLNKANVQLSKRWQVGIRRHHTYVTKTDVRKCTFLSEIR